MKKLFFWSFAEISFEPEGKRGFAVFVGIVESGDVAVVQRCRKEETFFGVIGQSDEAGFAGGISAGFHIELVQVHPSVGEVHADFCVVDGRSVLIVDDEVGGTRADPGVDLGDGLVIGGRGVLRG